METNIFFERIASYMPAFLAALPVAIAVIIAGMLVNFIIGRGVRIVARRTHLVESDLTPIRHVLRWIIRIIVIIAVAGIFGFELGGMWTMLSTILVTMAIGFVAVWSVLSNLSSTMLMLFLRPFHVGDDIEIAGDPVKGRVIDLNFFYTTLLESDGRTVQVPNNLFFQKVIKRRPGEHTLSLAHQISSPTPAPLNPPPKEMTDYDNEDEIDRAAKARKKKEPDPLMSVPDPATISPRLDR